MNCFYSASLHCLLWYNTIWSNWIKWIYSADNQKPWSRIEIFFHMLPMSDCFLEEKGSYLPKCPDNFSVFKVRKRWPSKTCSSVSHLCTSFVIASPVARKISRALLRLCVWSTASRATFDAQNTPQVLLTLDCLKCSCLSRCSGGIITHNYSEMMVVKIRSDSTTSWMNRLLEQARRPGNIILKDHASILILIFSHAESIHWKLVRCRGLPCKSKPRSSRVTLVCSILASRKVWAHYRISSHVDIHET